MAFTALKRGLGGGYIQRAESSGRSDGFVHTSSATRPPSKLAKLLITRWAWGHGTFATTIRDSSEAALEDGASHPDLIRLSELGIHPHRALLRMMAPSPLTAAIMDFEIPYKKHWSICRPEVEFQTSSILLPHVLFHVLYHQAPEVFKARILGGGFERINMFWKAMEGNPQREDNEALRARPDFETKCIPFSLHGDGVPITACGKSWGKSGDVYSTCSILGKGFRYTYT